MDELTTAVAELQAATESLRLLVCPVSKHPLAERLAAPNRTHVRERVHRLRSIEYLR